MLELTLTNSLARCQVTGFGAYLPGLRCRPRLTKKEPAALTPRSKAEAFCADYLAEAARNLAAGLRQLAELTGALTPAVAGK